MKAPLPALSAEARALLGAGKGIDPLPPAVQERMWGEIAAGLSIPPPTAPPSVPAAVPSGVGAAAAKLQIWALAKPISLALGLAGAGLATLAVHHFRSAQLSATVAAPAPPVPAVAASALPIAFPPLPDRPTTPPQPATRLRRATAPKPAVPPPAAAEVPSVDEDLAAEQSLLAQAQAALRRRAPRDALELLRHHAERFSTGRLSEEREALRIEALVDSGDRDAARAAAERFARDYPRGLLRAAVQAAVRQEP